MSWTTEHDERWQDHMEGVAKDHRVAARADDTEWALPGREPERQIDYRREPPAKVVAALESIAKTLDLIRLEISMMNMSKDRMIR